MCKESLLSPYCLKRSSLSETEEQKGIGWSVGSPIWDSRWSHDPQSKAGASKAKGGNLWNTAKHLLHVGLSVDGSCWAQGLHSIHWSCLKETKPESFSKKSKSCFGDNLNDTINENALELTVIMNTAQSGEMSGSYHYTAEIKVQLQLLQLIWM